MAHTYFKLKDEADKVFHKANYRPQRRNKHLLQYRKQLNCSSYFRPIRNPNIETILQWKPASSMLQPLEIPVYPVQFIDTKEKAMKFHGHLLSQRVLALDLEENNESSFLGMICTIQISTQQSTYIYDPLPAEMMQYIKEDLKTVLESPDIMKLVHGAANDVIHLQRDYGIFPVGFIDTQLVYSTAYNTERMIKLEDMAKELLHVKETDELPKYSDWRVRPLHPRQIDYAARDVHYVMLSWNEMLPTFTRELSIHNRYGTMYTPVKQSNEMTARCYRFPKASNWAKDVENKLTTREKSIFARLWNWRLMKAKELDQPARSLIRNQHLNRLAAIQPATAKDILSIASVHELLRDAVCELIPLLSSSFNEDKRQTRDDHQGTSKSQPDDWSVEFREEQDGRVVIPSVPIQSSTVSWEKDPSEVEKDADAATTAAEDASDPPPFCVNCYKNPPHWARHCTEKRNRKRRRQENSLIPGWKHRQNVKKRRKKLEKQSQARIMRSQQVKQAAKQRPYLRPTLPQQHPF